MLGVGDLLQGECESEQSSSVCVLQKSSWSQWLLSAALATERFLRYSTWLQQCFLFRCSKFYSC